MSTFQRVSVASVFGITLVFILICQFPVIESSQTSPRPAVMRVGFIVPLTGPLAEFGLAIQNGVLLAQEEISHSGEVFKAVYEDSQYDSKLALTSFQKLIARDQVNLTYVFGGPMSETLAPIAEAKKAPLYTTEYNPELTRGRQYVIRFANTSYDFADELLANLRSRGLRRFAIVKCENQYHNTLSSALESRLRPGESVMVVANHLPGDQGFYSTISKLRTLEFDALGVYLLPGMQNAFMKQLQDQQLRFPLFGTDTFETDSENIGVESIVAGAVYANADVQEGFRKRYEARFGNTSQLIHAALGYEFARLLQDSFAQDQTFPIGREVISRLNIRSPRTGAAGKFKFSEDPEVGQHFKFRLSVKQVGKTVPN